MIALFLFSLFVIGAALQHVPTQVAHGTTQLVANKAADDVDSGDCSELKNHGSHFTVELLAGEKEAKFDVVVDTGSDELVLPSCQCKKAGACSGRCLKDPIPDESHKVSLSYGSGGVQAAVMSGTVRVGSVTASMDESMLVMYDNDLDLAGHFEGILALGPPHREGSKRMVRLPDKSDNSSLADPKSSKGAEALGDEDRYFYTKSFLEEAGVSTFSLCFNRGSYGVLRLDSARATEGALGSIGGIHWGLGLAGVSLGEKGVVSSRSVTCAPGSSDSGKHNPCGAIPDSGTTFLMAPQKQIDELYEGLCKEWPPCREAADNKSGLASASELFSQRVESCEDLDSLPTVNFHLTGAGSSRTLQIPGSAYVYRLSFDCHLAFDVLEYHTEQNGPVWILGLPLFFTYRVGYDVSSKPPSMSFETVACTSCSDSFFRGRVGTKTELQWQMNGSPRKPSINLSHEL